MNGVQGTFRDAKDTFWRWVVLLTLYRKELVHPSQTQGGQRSTAHSEDRHDEGGKKITKNTNGPETESQPEEQLGESHHRRDSPDLVVVVGT